MKHQLKRWFGNSIMIFQIDDYKSINEDIKELIIQGVEPSNDPFAKTTDLEEHKDINDNLHRNKKFKKLFKEIEKTIIIFLKEHEYNLNAFNIYITKAWATLTKKNQLIGEHRHSASHYSIVYYVEAENQGDLSFNKPEPAGLSIPSSTDYYTENNEHNIESITYSSRTGDLIIFPSNMIHYTEENQQESPRISISLDMILTMKEGYVSEHNLSSPETWKKIKI